MNEPARDDFSRPDFDDKNVVGIRELRQNLSVYLERIKAGVTLTVTDRGVPVAQLAPIVAAPGTLAHLVASGLARPPVSPRRPLSPPIKLDKSLGLNPASDMLLQMRDEENF